MASSTTDWFEQGNKAWTRAQQDYLKNWDNWTKANGAASPFSAFNTPNMPGMGQWGEGLNQWQKMFMPQAPDPVKDFMDRTTEMGKSFMQMAETFYSAGPDSGEAGEDMIDGWLNAMQGGFKQWKKQLESGYNVDMPEIFGIEKVAMQSWQEMADSMMRGMTPGDWEFPGFSAAMFPETGKARDHLDKMLGIPALGYSREKQQKVQRLAELLVKYGEALKAYKIAFAKEGITSIKAMKKKLSRLDQPIESMRGLYDFWVDVNEEVYAKFAMTDEYQVVYGDLVNSLMAVKQVSNDIADDIYQSMHLPTRSEVDSLAQAVQQSRRENRHLKKQLAELTKRFDEQPDNPVTQAARKKATSRKKASKKKPSVKTQASDDDLTRIKGIGPKMQEQLNEQGITMFKQLAAMNKQAIEDMEKAINAGGKATREQWVKQAKGMLGQD